MTSPGDGPAWDPTRFTRRPAPTAPSATAVTSEPSPPGPEAPEPPSSMPPPAPRVAAPVESLAAVGAPRSWRPSAPPDVVATEELPDPPGAAVGTAGEALPARPLRRRTPVVAGSVSAVLVLTALAFAVGTSLRPGETEGPPLAASRHGDIATDVAGEGEPGMVAPDAGAGLGTVAGSDPVSPDPADQPEPYAPPSATPFFTAIVTSQSEDARGRAAAERFAARIEAAGHPAYVYRSGDYSHLRSGYWVASAGAFSTLDAARSAARVLGEVFPDVELVYPRCVGDAGSCAGQD